MNMTAHYTYNGTMERLRQDFEQQYYQNPNFLVQEEAEDNKITQLMIIRKAQINSKEYSKIIKRIREQFEGIEKKLIDYTSIKKLHDDSISIGLCGYYLASTSIKLKCPFDIRDADYHFYNIDKELNPENLYYFNETKNKTIPRCTKFCRFKLCGEDTFILDERNKYLLSEDKYEKIIVKSLKNFVVKI